MPGEQEGHGPAGAWRDPQADGQRRLGVGRRALVAFVETAVRGEIVPEIKERIAPSFLRPGGAVGDGLVRLARDR